MFDFGASHKEWITEELPVNARDQQTRNAYPQLISRFNFASDEAFLWASRVQRVLLYRSTPLR
jgi:hypothetical protein